MQPTTVPQEHIHKHISRMTFSANNCSGDKPVQTLAKTTGSANPQTHLKVFSHPGASTALDMYGVGDMDCHSNCKDRQETLNIEHGDDKSHVQLLSAGWLYDMQAHANLPKSSSLPRKLQKQQLKCQRQFQAFWDENRFFVRKDFQLNLRDSESVRWWLVKTWGHSFLPSMF